MAENNDDLPSYGMSKFLEIEDEGQVKNLMSRIQEGKHGSYILPGPSFPKRSDNSKSSSSDDDQKFRARGQRSSSPVSMEISGPTANTSRISTPLGKGKTFADLKPMVGTSTHGHLYKNMQLSSTLPLGTSMQTIDISQLKHINTMSDDQLFDSGDSGEEKSKSPELKIWTASYNRFRYPSERNKKKKRQYEMDEEKSCLATVTLVNYEGACTIIAYCVDKDGKLHPFGLYGGENCNEGVYKATTTFGKRCSTFKITKVSMTSAKIKDYNECLKDQRKHLKKLGAFQDGKIPLDVETSKVDKQIVYIMFKVMLSDGTILSKQSTAVNNKKEGSEFCIHRIQPPSAPACGRRGYNDDSQKIVLIVTENTAFPKDVGVVIRSKTGDWEKILKGGDIHVIKKAVVEFLPPAYKDPEIESEVEVDISLKDLKTGIETDPAIFVYTTKDQYGLGSKGKKRKLEEEEYIPTQNLQDNSQRRTLQAARNKKSAATSLDSSFESSGSSTENSLTEYQVKQPQIGSSLAAPGTSPQDRVISLGTARQSSPLPFTNYSPSSLPANVPAEYSAANMGSPGFDVSHIMSQQQGGTNVSSPGFLSQADNQNYGSASSATVVTSTMSVFSTQPTSTQSMQSMPTLSCSQQNQNNSTVIDPQQLALLQLQQQQQQPNAAKIQELLRQFQHEEQQKNPHAQFNESLTIMDQVMNLPKEKKVQLLGLLSMYPQSQPQEQTSQTLNLPPLGPKQQYALIDGQILIVNDDLAETTPPSSTVQDIAGQQVLVQPVPLQQPSDEASETSDQLLTFTEAGMSTLSGTMTNQQFQQNVNGGMNAYQQLQNQPGFNFGASNYPLAPGQSGVNFTQNPVLQSSNPTQPLVYQGQQYPQQQMTGQQNLGNQYQNPSTSNNEPLFWRSVIPSTPCNLDDDDVEIDSGPTNDNSSMQGKTQINTNTASDGGFRNYSSSRGSSPFSDRPSSRGSSSNDVEVDGVVYDVEETTGNLKYANVANDDGNDVNLASLTLDHDYDNHDNS